MYVSAYYKIASVANEHSQMHSSCIGGEVEHKQ